jgi:hypothetical protein
MFLCNHKNLDKFLLFSSLIRNLIVLIKENIKILKIRIQILFLIYFYFSWHEEQL